MIFVDISYCIMNNSTMNSSGLCKKKLIQGIPVVLKSDMKMLPNKMGRTTIINLKNKINNSNSSPYRNLIPLDNFKIQTPTRNDVIFETANGNDECLRGKYQKMSLVNNFNVVNNTNRTHASFLTLEGNTVEHTSDNLVKLIGQSNYDSVFLALCSVISQDLKIKSILSLLTSPKNYKDVSVQTDYDDNLLGKCAKDKLEDITSPLFWKSKQRKIRRQLGPYVVKDVPKNANSKKVPQDKTTKTSMKQVNRIVIHPNNVNEINEEISETEKDKIGDICRKESEFESIIQKENADLHDILDDDHENSVQSISNLSVASSVIDRMAGQLIDQISELSSGEISSPNPNCTNKTFGDVIEFRNRYPLEISDGSIILLPFKPDDKFHLLTPSIVERLDPLDQNKLRWYQACIDWKYCLERNEDGNLPIHVAALENDVELIKRHCVMLNMKKVSVDIESAHGNLTALQLAIKNESSEECVQVLLDHGADILEPDDEEFTALHHAAEAQSPKQLALLIKHMEKHTRKILEANDLWQPSLQQQTPEYWLQYLNLHASTQFENQGYTPLMLACKLGHREHVKLLLKLLKASPQTVNVGMRNCGNTALYLAVDGAYNDAVERGNRSKVSLNYLKTVEQLVEFGADPSIMNQTGASVNLLLTEFSMPELSQTIANKMCDLRIDDLYPAVKLSPEKSFFLIKDGEGNFTVEDNKKIITDEKVKYKYTVVNDTKPHSTAIRKPIILKRSPNFFINDDTFKALANNIISGTHNNATNIVLHKPIKVTETIAKSSGADLTKQRVTVNIIDSKKIKIADSKIDNNALKQNCVSTQIVKRKGSGSLHLTTEYKFVKKKK